MYVQVVRLQQFLDAQLGNRDDVAVLEAGCGSASHLRLDAYQHVAGIDISEQQLERNTTLHEKILGDLESYEFPDRRFDLIVCWDVLEHLPHPERAVERFGRAIKDDGLIVLAMPNVRSAKGQVAKLTPHWFHVWWYRTIFGVKHAGTKDQGPFKTFLRKTIAPKALRELAHQQGLQVAYFAIYESDTQADFRKRIKLTGIPWTLFNGAVKTFSLGGLDAAKTDYIIVLRRPAAQTAWEMERGMAMAAEVGA